MLRVDVSALTAWDQVGGQPSPQSQWQQSTMASQDNYSGENHLSMPCLSSAPDFPEHEHSDSEHSKWQNVDFTAVTP